MDSCRQPAWRPPPGRSDRRGRALRALGARVFPSTPDRTRETFAELMRMVGLEECAFTLGSFRPGGATSRFIGPKNVPAIQIAGRWAYLGSLECYLQEAVCALVAAQTSDLAPVVALQAFSAELSRPPLAPWESFFS